MADAGVDVVTVAQAWHWFDATAAAAECARVLRPGGVLGIGWHVRDDDLDWVRELDALVGRQAEATASRWDVHMDLPEPFGPVQRALFAYRQRLAIDDVVALAASWSYVAVRTDREEVLAGIAELARGGAGGRRLRRAALPTCRYRGAPLSDPPVALPHPVTGQPFDSPVPPGGGWPGDPADAGTEVATTAAAVRRLAARADQQTLQARISVCRACPRLVAWREQVALTRRRSFANQPYWGRPLPGWGEEHPWLLVVGLAPAAHGGNRTGRIFTGDRSGDWIYAALHRAGLATRPTSVAAGDGQRLVGVRIAAAVRCAPPDNKPTPAERDACAPWLDRELRLVGRACAQCWRSWIRPGRPPAGDPAGLPACAAAAEVRARCPPSCTARFSQGADGEQARRPAGQLPRQPGTPSPAGRTEPMLDAARRGLFGGPTAPL